MTNVYIASEKITEIGGLNRTLDRIFTAKFCNDIVSVLMNDINASSFGEDIILRIRAVITVPFKGCGRN